MPEIYLPLFPLGSLDSSVITTTWIGIFVVAFFNLRFGWVLSGLVVPGYLVPLMIIKPWAAASVLLEGVVTYGIVWFFSEYLSRYGRWSALFGRDRFFALILVSIVVRIVFDGWVLPLTGEYVTTRFDIAFDYRNNLHSFGLIIVALLANQFWKPGLRRGLVPVAVYLGLTWFLVRFVLMEFTNFRISDIGYLYEDLAASILASPKAYIILVTTAFLASRMNLHYGWEFNGILIPALIALQWYQPAKILASIVEAVIIYGLAEMLLHSPLLAGRNIEGARKLLLFFNIGFVYKLLLGWGLFYLAPGVKVTDYFGFGYLLSTLIAIKIHDKDILARLTRATLQTSLVGVLVATGLGFVLSLLPDLRARVVSTAASVVEADVPAERGTLSDLLDRHKIQLFSGVAGIRAPTQTELQDFRAGVRELRAWLVSGNPVELARAEILLRRSGFAVRMLENRFLCLVGEGAAQSGGLYVFDTRGQGMLAVEVPDPLEQRGLMDAADVLFRQLDARMLALPGLSRRRSPAAGADVLQSFDTYFQAFHAGLDGLNVLQVRAFTTDTLRALQPETVAIAESAEPGTAMWVKTRLPEDLDVVRLRRLVEPLKVRWGDAPLVNLQAESSWTGFAELFLDQRRIRDLVFRAMLPGVEEEVTIDAAGIRDFLQVRLLETRDEIAPAGSDLYSPPTLQELMYLDVEVVTPLLDWVRRREPGTPLDGEALDRFRGIYVAAGAVGLQVTRYVDPAAGGEFVFLTDRPGAERRYWGTHVFRVGDAAPLAVQVPRPLVERNTLEYSISLFGRSQARALLIAGAHVQANRDGSADLVKWANRHNLVNLVGQVMQREEDGAPFLVAQVRGFGLHSDRPPPEADILVAFDNGAVEDAELTPLGHWFSAHLDEPGNRLERVGSGASESMNYGIGRLPQAAYLGHTETAEFALVWLSPGLRAEYRQVAEDASSIAPFLSMGIPDQEGELDGWLKARGVAPGFDPDSRHARLVSEFVVSADVTLLWALHRERGDGALTRLVDRDTRQTFLVLHDDAGRVEAVANLVPRSVSARRMDSTALQGERAEAVRDFAKSGQAWLVFGAGEGGAS